MKTLKTILLAAVCSSFLNVTSFADDLGTKAELHLIYWLTTDATGTTSSYRSYLDRFPEGACSTLARERLMEAESWENVKNQTGTHLIERHLVNFPNGKFADAARTHLRRQRIYDSTGARNWDLIPEQNSGKLDLSERVPNGQTTSEKECEDVLTGKKELVSKTKTDIDTAQAPKNIMNRAKSLCEELGFEPKTEKYGDCVLKLMEMN